MRRGVVSLRAMTVAGGCGGAPGGPYPFAGWPDLAVPGEVLNDGE